VESSCLGSVANDFNLGDSRWRKLTETRWLPRQSRIAPEPKELERTADAEETRRDFFAKKTTKGGVEDSFFKKHVCLTLRYR